MSDVVDACMAKLFREESKEFAAGLQFFVLKCAEFGKGHENILASQRQ